MKEQNEEIAAQESAAEVTIARCTKLLELEPQDVVAWFDRANAHHLLKHEQECMDDYAQVIELCRQPAGKQSTYAKNMQAQCYRRQGEIYKSRGEYQESIRCYSTLLQFDRSAASYASRAEVYKAVDLLKEALADMDMAITLSDFYFHYESRAEIHQLMNNREKQQADLATYRVLQQKEKEKWKQRKRTRQESAKPTRQQHFINPVYNHYKEPVEAENDIQRFNAVIASMPNDVESFFHRANAFYHLNRDVESLEDFKTVSSKYPDNVWSIKMSARIHLESGDLAAALNILNFGLEEDGDQVPLLEARAFALMQLQRTDEALDDMDSAVNLCKPHNFYYNVPRSRGYMCERLSLFEQASQDKHQSKKMLEASRKSNGVDCNRFMDHYNWVDSSGNLLLKMPLDRLGELKEDRAFARNSERLLIGYINSRGEWLIKPEYTEAFDFSEGLAGVCFDDQSIITGKFGYIDLEGNLVIAPRYGDCGPFRQGRARVRVGRMLGRWGYIDPTGHEVIPPSFDRCWDFQEGAARVKAGAHFGYIDLEGRLLTDFRFDDAEAFWCGRARVQFAGKWGYVNISGAAVIETRFDNATKFSDELAMVQVDGKWGVIDTEGKMLVEPQFKEAGEFKNALAWVRDANNKIGAIDRSGQYIIAPNFAQTNACFQNGVSAARSTDKWGYVATTGEWVIDAAFDEALPFHEGIAAVRMGQDWRFIDSSGAWLFDRKFHEVHDFNHQGRALVGSRTPFT